MPEAIVGGITLHYEVRGTGPPLVLIPGLGGDVRLFRRVIDALAQHVRVLAFDPRGAGRSDKPDDPYSVALLADDAHGLMGAVGVPSASVLGFSMGGRVALDLTLRHPAAVTSLILVSTAARTLPYPRGTCRWLVMDVLARVPLPSRVDPQPRYAHDRQRAASRDYDCSARLGEIHVPTLILHGNRDRITSPARAEELRRGIAGSRLVIVGGGHMAVLGKARNRLAQEVAGFVASAR